MQLRLLLCFLTLLCTCARAHTQSNWRAATVHLTDGEVLYGRVDDRNWTEHFSEIRWRQGNETSVQVIALTDLTRLRIGDRHYRIEDVTVDQSPRDLMILTPRHEHEPQTVRAALLVLVEGPLSLYEYLDRRTNSHFFLEEEGGPLRLLNYALYRTFGSNEELAHKEDNSFRGQLAAAMVACPRLSASLRELTYERDAIMGALEQYYNCGRQSSGYWYTQRKHAILFGPDLGVVQTTANYGKLLPDQFRFTGLVSNDLTFGGHVKYRFGGRSGMATLRLAAMYQRWNISQSTPETTFAGAVTTENYLAEEQSLHIQFGPQISFVPTRYPIFIESFIEYHHMLRYTEFQFTRQVSPAGEEIIGTPFDFSGTGALGLTMGFGVGIGKATVSLRGTAVRRNYGGFVLNVYRIGVIGGYDF